MNFFVCLLYLMVTCLWGTTDPNASFPHVQQAFGDSEGRKQKSLQDVTEGNSYPIHSPTMDSTDDIRNSDLHKLLQPVFSLEKNMLLADFSSAHGDAMKSLCKRFAKFPVTEIELHKVMADTLAYLSEFCESYKTTVMLFKEQLKQLGQEGADIKPYVDLVMKIQMDFTTPQALSMEVAEALSRVTQHSSIKKWLNDIKVVYPRGVKIGLKSIAWDDGAKSAVREFLCPNLLITNYYDGTRSWYAEIMVNRSSSLGMLKAFVDREIVESKSKRLIAKPAISVAGYVAKEPTNRCWLTRLICGKLQK